MKIIDLITRIIKRGPLSYQCYMYDNVELLVFPASTNIPWSVTSSSEKSRRMLNDIYNSLEDGTDLKLFINDRCQHLLERPVGDTGYPINYFDNDYFMNSHPLPVPLNDRFTSDLVKDYKLKSGCYSFYCPSTQEYYFGANLKFGPRLRQHYHNSTRLDLLLYIRVKELGFSKFVWQPTVVTPNYYIEYMREHLTSGEDYTVYQSLTSFSKYETRLYEQAFKSYVSPTLNGAGEISFPVNWDIKDVRDTFHTRPFIAVTSQGKEYSFASVINGAEVLGTSRKTIDVVINYNHYVECKGINDTCRFYEPGRTILEGSPYANPYNQPTISGIDYKSLSLGTLYAFDENFEVRAKFNSSSDASRACGFGEDYYRISRYINNKFIEVVLGGETIKLLFAQNPLSKGRSKAVVRIDVTTGEVQAYESVRSAYHALGYSNDCSFFRKQYVKGDKVYNNKYTFDYLSNYTGSVPPLQKVGKGAS